MNARHPFVTFEQRGESLIAAAPNDSVAGRLSRREQQIAALLDLVDADTSTRREAVLHQHGDSLETLLAELAWEVISLRERVRR